MVLIPGGSMARLRARFRDQFTPVVGGYVYRRGSRGAALPVSARDADAFIAAFENGIRWLAWGGVLGTIAVLGTLTALDVRWPASLAPYANWVVAVSLIAIWCALCWLAWNAPYRALNGRAPLAPALTGSQVRRRGLLTLQWRWLVLGALVSIRLAVRVLFEPGSDDRGYLIYAGVLLLVFAGLALAKLRAR